MVKPQAERICTKPCNAWEDRGPQNTELPCNFRLSHVDSPLDLDYNFQYGSNLETGFNEKR